MSSRKPANATKQETPAKKGGWGFQGADAVNQARRENEIAKQKMETAGIFRFYLAPEQSTEIVILDHSLDDAFGMWEHAIPGPGDNWKETVYEPSPRTLGQEDPLETHPVVNGKTSKPYYAMFFTILDLTPYTNKKGEVVPYSRKLLPVKRMQADKFAELAKNAEKKFGSLRGLHLKMTRGPKGAGVNSSIGEPGPLSSLEFGFFTEAELVKRFGHPAVTGDNNKVIIPANGKIQPFDYLSIFKKPDVDDIRKRYGIGAPMGSAAEEAEVWGEVVEQDVADADSTQPEQDPDLVNFA